MRQSERVPSSALFPNSNAAAADANGRVPHGKGLGQARPPIFRLLSLWNMGLASPCPMNTRHCRKGQMGQGHWWSAEAHPHQPSLCISFRRSQQQLEARGEACSQPSNSARSQSAPLQIISGAPANLKESSVSGSGARKRQQQKEGEQQGSGSGA